MKNQIKLSFLLTMFMSMVGARAFAHDIAVTNADYKLIFYNFTNNSTELEVTSCGYIPYEPAFDYTGDIAIPQKVTYKNHTYKVTTIGKSAFKDSSGLTSITIPNSVRNIGESAFAGCSGLTSITIPSSLTSIEDNAFNECEGLKKVIILDIAAWCGISFGDNPLAYAHHIYSDETTEIMDLVIPYGVTNIENDAFSWCFYLTSVKIPNTITSIGQYAFYGCRSLTSITIPNSVTTIGNSSFADCTGVTSVTIGNKVTTIGEYAFDSCKGLTSITIPNSVSKIGNSAFSRCSSLESVTLGASVRSIGNSAFRETNLSTIISLINYPFDLSNPANYTSVFDSRTYNYATLYVPLGTKDNYKSKYGWASFSNIVEIAPTATQSITLDKNINTSLYDLNGKKLKEPSKGINIIDGKKVLLK